MNFKSNAFNAVCKNIGDNNYLHIINIEEIDLKLKKLIDSSIVEIWDGPDGDDIDLVKTELLEFFRSKEDSNIEKGAVAEFFLHLYLRDIGFKQECLFQNLEERSIKKGFDGYYSFENEEWVMESKSGSINTAGISHQGKIKEAYNDLNSKFLGKSKNNPWKNAFRHAKTVDSSKDILKNIKKLSKDYTSKIFYDSEQFNIIPSSTIFLEGNWKNLDIDEIESNVSELVSKFKFKKINIICVNKKSLKLFLDYIGI